MLCYRCGSHVPDGSEACGACGQKFSSGNLRQTTGTFSRKKLGGTSIEGAPFKPGDLLENRYLIKDVVGSGPLGFVFKAQDKEIEVELALKTVSAKLVQTPDERKSFSREVRLARKLSHNNLVRVYEDGETQDRPFYTMQFLDGLTLRRIVDLRREKNQNFSLKEIEPIFAQIAAGLDSAHKVGPHGNLKPENVIVLPDLLKLTDFGLGLAVPRQPFANAQRARGGHRYLAPEYLAGHEVDGRADVYAMGVILGEMVAGVFPDGGSAPELRSRNPELPVAVEALYRKATNENPQARQATPGELFAELAAISSAGEPKSSRRPPAPPPIEQAAARRAPPVPPPVESPKPPPAPRRSAVAPPTPEADPAFVRPPSAQRENTQTDVTPVYPPPPTGRPGHQAKPKPQKKSSNGLLFALAVVGVVVGIGGGWALLNYVGPADPGSGGPAVPGTGPSMAVDAGRPAATGTPSSDSIEKQRLAEEQRRAEAARVAEQQRRAEEERKLAAQQEAEKLAAAKAEEERLRKEALEKAFAANDTKDEPAAKAGCPSGMRLIAAGSFKMGTARDDPMMGFDEKALSTVNLKAYCVDYFESPNHKGAQPQVNVTYAAAEAACKQRGKRLCTEEEWERACKGPSNLRFPYSNTFDAAACNTEDANGEDREVSTTGSFARCRSGFGISDMAGNVAEWTSSKYNDEVADRTLKGGAADRPDYATRCAARKNGPPSTKSDKIGFRCCADPK